MCLKTVDAYGLAGRIGGHSDADQWAFRRIWVGIYTRFGGHSDDRWAFRRMFLYIHVVLLEYHHIFLKNKPFFSSYTGFCFCIRRAISQKSGEKTFRKNGLRR